jgi:hypothetical protein
MFTDKKSGVLVCLSRILATEYPTREESTTIGIENHVPVSDT